ncbi:hypothetical protein ACJMK2_033461 [Sinanodonta woodiana]|uniref:Chibby n=1 Tax=Sinanodonta woodiana TaxID=1069815 RepID=A0ABD3WSL4_SINWO
MPLFPFGDKFSPKKTPPRRAQSLSNLHLDATQAKQEFGLDTGPVRIRLGGQEVTFQDGMWVQDAGPGASSHKEVMKLRRDNQHLQEENNLLKLKLELLLDMLAETSAISHYHENELKQLKTGKKR